MTVYWELTELQTRETGFELQQSLAFDEPHIWRIHFWRIVLEAIFLTFDELFTFDEP